MKKLRLPRIATMIVVVILMASALAIPALAKKPLDEILDYQITINMRTDGTMDMRYDITWKVLDSKTDGPLEWVKIGCPNSHVDEITAITTDTIKKIGYMSERGDSYIRVDLDRKYEAGETVTFSYSIHQAYMYVIEEDQHICRYSFTPGWFDDIDVDNLTIYWNATNVIESTAPAMQNGYLVWSGAMPAGQRLNASVRYNLDVFATNPDQQYVEGDKSELGTGAKIGIAILVIVVIVIIVAACMTAASDDDYYGGRGMGGGSHTTFIHTTTRSSCVSSCACVSCACACACAGGGRAGCSLKDFYHTNLTSEMIVRVIDGDQPDN